MPSPRLSLQTLVLVVLLVALGAALYRASAPFEIAHRLPRQGFAVFSPDSTKCAVVDHSGEIIVVLDVRSSYQHEIKTTEFVGYLAFTADASELVMVGHNKTWVWVIDADCIRRDIVGGAVGYYWEDLFAQSAGRILLFEDPVWKVVDLRTFREFPVACRKGAMPAISIDGRLVAAASPEGITLVEVESGRPLGTLPQSQNPQAWTAPSFLHAHELAALRDDGDLYVWRIDNWNLQLRKSVASSECYKVCPAPDGRILFCTGPGWTHALSRRDFTSRWHNKVTSFMVTPDSREVLGTNDGHAMIVSAQTGEQLFRFGEAKSSIYPVMSPDGNWVITGNYDGSGAILWRRLRPCAWWGIFVRPELWCFLVVAGVFVRVVFKNFRPAVEVHKQESVGVAQ